MDKEVEIIEDLIPRFHNLIRIEFHCALINLNWLEVFKVINNCPKLQHLLVNLVCLAEFLKAFTDDLFLMFTNFICLAELTELL